MENKTEMIGVRNHFTYIFEQMWGLMIVFVAILFQSADNIKMAYKFLSQGNFVQAIMALGGVLLLLIIIFVFHLNRWYKTSFTLKDGNLTTERRTLNRKVNSIAVQNISNINLNQNLFEMLMGTYKVKLDTNTMSTADQTDVQIVLKKKDAYRLKQLILEMMQEIQLEQAKEHGLVDEDGNVVDASLSTDLVDEEEQPEHPGGALPYMLQNFVDEENEQYDVDYSVPEVVKSCFLSTTFLGILFFFGSIIGMIVLLVVGILSGKSLVSIFATILAAFAVFGTIITTYIKRWLGMFHFRAKRKGDKIQISSGLIDRKQYAVPVDKINAVQLTSTWLGRLLGCAYVKVINVGGEGEDVNGMQILLVEKYDKLQEHLATLLPEFRFPELNQIDRQPKCALVKNRIYSAIYMIIFGIAIFAGIWAVERLANEDVFSQIPTWGYALFVIGLILLYVFSFFIEGMRYKLTGMDVLDEYLVLSNGTFVQTITCIPYSKIQYITYQQGPIERKLHVKHGNISILASSLSRTQIFRVFDQSRLERLDEMLRRTY